MRTLIAALFTLLALPLLAQTPVPNPADVGHTTGDFHGCAPTGDAKLQTGHSDPFLNALKNRDEAPDESEYVTKTVTAVIAEKPAGATAAGKKRRDKWTATQRTSIAAKEKTAIQVVGFLVKVKKEDLESCNCHTEGQVDFHMWLVAHEGETREKSMVVEISPRLLEDHPRWVELARKAAAEGTLVRVRGWRTWDHEHPEQLGRTRGTMWEIHPIHEIDVEDENGDWVPIDQE
ncbi:MAG: hypothetical protein JWO97_3872 [Acidobacteria bacterium]|nr:hypothetical protein [Acidobacteriota bacterium]